MFWVLGGGKEGWNVGGVMYEEWYVEEEERWREKSGELEMARIVLFTCYILIYNFDRRDILDLDNNLNLILFQ